MTEDTPTVTKKPKRIETIRLKVFMVTTEMTLSDLSRLCKIPKGTLKVQVATDWPSSRCRVAVEHAIQRPIWSTSTEFKKRQAQIAAFGFVPQLKTWKELRNLALKLGVPRYYELKNREDLIRELYRFMTAKTATTPTPPRL